MRQASCGHRLPHLLALSMANQRTVVASYFARAVTGGVTFAAFSPRTGNVGAFIATVAGGSTSPHTLWTAAGGWLRLRGRHHAASMGRWRAPWMLGLSFFPTTPHHLPYRISASRAQHLPRTRTALRMGL